MNDPLHSPNWGGRLLRHAGARSLTYCVYARVLRSGVPRISLAPAGSAKGLLLLLLTVVGLSACTAMHPPKPYLPDRSGIEEGETITVKGNENIYAIAHEHNVSMRELIVINNLKPPFEVKPGQSLVLPATGTSFAGEMKPPAAAPLDAVEKNALAPIQPPAVMAQPLEPMAAPAPAQVPANNAPQSLVVPPATTNLQTAAQSTEPVQALNRPKPMQQPTATTMTSPSTATAEAAVNMVWPVQGPILSNFGAKGVGLSNDGINIGAPKGAPVVAAAPGTVVYAGDEMKGFGNLVLIRHQNDWVTAYAHLDRVMVKKDSVVAQGDMIGTVGKTGNVPSPQLHFETRQNGKPVDPAGVIKAAP